MSYIRKWLQKNTTISWLRLAGSGLVLLNLVGLIGLQTEVFHEVFLTLVPLHLFITFLVLVRFQDWNKPNLLIAALIIILGFLAEVFGVKTGLLFGHYSYGNALGPKIAAVPLIMGFNWLVLCLSALSVSDYWVQSPIWKVPLAAALMTTLDVIMEQTAPNLDFWHWENSIIPIRNSVGWLICSVIFAGLLQWGASRKHNPIGPLVFWLQAAFFTALLVIKLYCYR
jgi:uncharacterized membrane protein